MEYDRECGMVARVSQAFRVGLTYIDSDTLALLVVQERNGIEIHAGIKGECHRTTIGIVIRWTQGSAIFIKNQNVSKRNTVGVGRAGVASRSLSRTTTSNMGGTQVRISTVANAFCAHSRAETILTRSLIIISPRFGSVEDTALITPDPYRAASNRNTKIILEEVRGDVVATVDTRSVKVQRLGVTVWWRGGRSCHAGCGSHDGSSGGFRCCKKAQNKPRL